MRLIAAAAAGVALSLLTTPAWTVDLNLLLPPDDDLRDALRAADEHLPEQFYHVILVDPKMRPIGYVTLSRILSSPTLQCSGARTTSRCIRRPAEYSG